ncbi:MAG: helix-turn-helix transcriptional regulator [Clostridiaceae bacterium]|nr:helix-turn-helix transcriptional regulator [Clostridiaceae bacterium]
MNDNITKQFKRGILEIVILKLLSKKEMYGYELVSELNRQAGTLNIKEGTLYPILYRLEDEGIMETRWEHPSYRGQPKKYYSITEKGKRVMTESYARWKAIAEDIMRIMEDQI